MNLYFIRHGEAVTAKLDTKGPERLSLIDRYGSGTYQGGLTEKGRRQAANAAEYLADKNIHRLYASPFARAHQTAEVSSERLGLDLHTRDPLKEVIIGFLRPESDLVVKTKMEAGLLVNDLFSKLTGRPIFPPVALYFMFLYMTGWLKGETHDADPPREVRRRLLDLLQEVYDEAGPDGNVALFSHGYLIYFLINHVLEPERKWVHLVFQPYIRNASVTHVSGEPGRWKVRCYAEPTGGETELGLGE